jgi:hypothetical protein
MEQRTQSTINPGETWPDYQARLAREISQGDQNARFVQSDPHFNADGSLRASSDPRSPPFRENFAQGVAEKAAPDALGTSEIAHLRHVLQKHFFHDQPEAVAIQAGSAGFCPMCPAPVTNTYDDGTAVCANGHRFPVQKIDRNPERR